MSFRLSILFVWYIYNLLEVTSAVKCYRDNSFLYNQTCEGDFCAAIRTGAFVSLRTIRTCVTGVKMPPYKCSLHWDDEMACYCNTDFCNTENIFRSNYTVFPIIGCKEVHKRAYIPVACNKCLRIISYVKNRIGPTREDEKETVQCSLQGESGDFVVDTVSFREEMIARNFYVDACYNISMHKEHYYVYCRCTLTDCNSPEVPIPYPLSLPTISCYTSGFDGVVNQKKYEKPDTYFDDNYKLLMANDSYVDEESQCSGHFCFVATVPAETGENKMDVYYKGCISANEHGDNTIQLGYLYLNEIPYYICNTDFCNLNREIALKEAKNSTIKIFFIFALHFYFSNAVKCYQDPEYDGIERTCEGDFCAITRSQSYNAANHQKTCLSGITKPSYNCSLSNDDTMTCICDSDFCNTPRLYLSNYTVFPIIECKSVIQKLYTAVACNKCIRTISYLKMDRYESDKYPNQNENLKDLEEEILCNNSDNSGDFVLDSRIYMPERMLRNFFGKACYNLSLHREHYYVHCRCSEPNCNTPETPNLPYPISGPRVKCYTSGYDAEVNNRKYQNTSVNYKEFYNNLRTNETFVDNDSECGGHFCFISISQMYVIDGSKDVYYKGCISANEQGDQKLSLGYSYLNDVPYYICNTDYCNIDIETALEEAKNASLTISDNHSERKNSLFLCVFLSLYFCL